MGTCVSVEWNNSKMISGSLDKSMKMWNLKDASSCLKTIEGHEDGVQCVSVDWSSQTALSASLDKTLKMWNLEDGTCTSTMEGHDSMIICLAVDWASKLAVSGARGSSKRAPKGYDRMNAGGRPEGAIGENLKIWDIASGACTKTLQGHEGDVLSVAIHGSTGRV